MSLATRVGKMERRPPAPDGRCPACEPHALILYPPGGGCPPAPACPRCGRTPGVLVYLPEKEPLPGDATRAA